MNKQEIKKWLKDIYDVSETASYLNISEQSLYQLVNHHILEPIKNGPSSMLFYKSDLDDYLQQRRLDINQIFVRDAILYYTIQYYCQQSDKKALAFIEQIQQLYGFDFHAGLKKNIPFLAGQFQMKEQEFYDSYLQIKKAFTLLPKDTYIFHQGDMSYPKQLASVKDAPFYLFVKGKNELLYQQSICIVGSREPSIQAIEKTKQLARSFVKDGFVINAGLAKGIDTIVHQTVLENYGKTMAIIGTSLHECYPKDNQALQKQIENDGLVVSQFPPMQSIKRWHFPKRNATMSGLSIGTVIMDAREKSGTLIQADYALKQGRYVFIPEYLLDDKQLQWPYEYIKKGAYVFSQYEDILKIIQKGDDIACGNGQR